MAAHDTAKPPPLRSTSSAARPWNAHSSPAETPEVPPPIPLLHPTPSTSLEQRSATEQRSIWDPSDSEWESGISAASITSTFTRSYRRPFDRGLETTTIASNSALGRLGSTVRDAWRTLRSASPTKNYDCEINGGQRDGSEQDGEMREILEKLRNTYYSDSNGDIHDEVMRDYFVLGSKYFTVPTLSISPARYMNVIDLAAYFTSSITSPVLADAKPRLPTAIATILSHTSPACITAFLDPRTEEFTYRREIDRNKAGLILVVRRQGNKVIAGAYRNFGFKLQWVAYVKAVIGMRGDWYEAYAAARPGYTQIKDGVVAWDEFCTDGDEGGEGPGGNGEVGKDKGGPRRLALAGPEKRETEESGVSPVEPKFMLYQSRVLARALLWDIWVRFEAMNECKATWEADGVVTDVRLQRVLLGFGEEYEE